MDKPLGEQGSAEPCNRYNSACIPTSYALHFLLRNLRDMPKRVRKTGEDSDPTKRTKVAQQGLNRELEVTNSLVDKFKQLGMNAFATPDGTRADLAVQLGGETGPWLGLQIKTCSPEDRSNDELGWSGVRGYEGMPVLLWVKMGGDQSHGWIVDGTALNQKARTGDTLFLSKKFRNKLSFGSLQSDEVSMDDVAQHLIQAALFHTLIGGPYAWRLHSADYLRWDVAGDSTTPNTMNVFTGRVAEYLETQLSPGFEFPSEPHAVYDLINAQGFKTQVKHASPVKTSAGFQVSLKHRVGGNPQQPYKVGDWDQLVVMHILWGAKKVAVWRIPVAKLENPKNKGYTFISPTVQASEADIEKYKPLLGPQSVKGKLWTLAYYKGVFDLPAFPDDALEASKRFFDAKGYLSSAY